MKTTQTRAGKKIKGRKRHIVVDTIGLADVHSASVQDRDGIFCSS
ncbi:transposase [Wolbachia endosymbiont of Armadillidium vulgare str. wVulC]|nr:transposase [Wolbachia endosymbiont of Armadillidium vulgare str. wVulC]